MYNKEILDFLLNHLQILNYEIGALDNVNTSKEYKEKTKEEIEEKHRDFLNNTSRREYIIPISTSEYLVALLNHINLRYMNFLEFCN